VIAAREENGKVSERSELALQEVIPGYPVVLIRWHFTAPEQREKILIRLVNPPEIAQVPVKRIFLVCDFGGKRRHDEVSAVPAIARNSEGPCSVRRLGLRNELHATRKDREIQGS
jgi:hypothetical protein